MEASSSASEANAGATGRLVLKNTLYLTLSQTLIIPISMLINALMARYLGEKDFGAIYFAATLTGFGYLLVDWGHQGALPALVARDHGASGPLLGTSMAWRVGGALLVYALLALGCHLLHYDARFQGALLITFAGALLTSFVAACKDTIRGFERTDIPAIAQVAQQVAVALFITPVLILGGGMYAVLVAQGAAVAVVLVPIARALGGVGVGKLAFDKNALKSLAHQGTPFVFFGLALALQPNIDAVYLSKLAPAEVMGWYAAARRLVGVMLFPASALIGALYPTLCRLHASDPEGFRRTASGALRGVSLLVVPVALGCELYPELGVGIFGHASFGPAENNLRVLALFLFLVYFSMPIGTTLLAAGRQRAWTIVQSLCVVVSLVLDPVLVRWMQARTGNGGVGVCIASALSEVIVIVCGLLLMPRGVLDRPLFRALALAVVSGGAMALVAHFTRWLTPYVAAPLALATYAVALVVTGGIDKEQLAGMRGFVARKFAGRRAG